MSNKDKKVTSLQEQGGERPSAASTKAPTSARPSAATPFLDSSVRASADEIDPQAPEHTTIPVQSSASWRAAASVHSNLAPHSESCIGERIDLPAGSVSEQLEGLTTEAATARIQEYGRNEIPEIDTPWYVLLGKQFIGVMPFMLELAAIVAACARSWPDLGIIMAMLILNGLIGFHEEHKAKQSLDALKSQMTATVPVKRDGQMVIMEVAELVPGDIIFLRGGNIVPADCEFIEGDEMSVDTAALTGEPIPRKVPRPDREGEEPGKGKELLSGCIIKQGEAHCEVKKTGLDTEIGQAAGLVQEASGHQVGVFETKIMQVVKAVILISFIDALVLLYVQVSIRGDKQGFQQSLLAVLAIVIGAVPIALPLVMQVTMAIGAGEMAQKKAIVTHLTALQEIASMTILCSDKTGTLTTANMRVMPGSIWTKGNHTQDDALVWAGVASNPANKEDPIDGSVLKSCAEHFGDQCEAELSAYKKHKFIGFNPTTKRTVVYCEHPKRGQMKISKGLTSKVLCTGEDGGDCWEVEGLEQIKEEVQQVDVNFSLQGYKTLGVTLAEGEGPMKFVAVVPMLDPPREDTMLTIYRIRQANVGVKMITGDHLNIAIETSRLIGLGTGILPASDLWPASQTRDETILTSDGFAQVLPKDKREVILVLQSRGLVVGMTGDGVNDAPALAQAQIGIAVDGATEAARSAADIILTSPGLSAIFDAVISSRMIFARLRAYVLYRMAATIQIVLVLSILIYAYDVVMNPLYVVLLALLNDISMIPIAQDNAAPSASPEIPSMPQILLASVIYGGLLTIQSVGFFEFGLNSDWLQGDDRICVAGSCQYLVTCTYLQISIAIELIILSCRAPGFILAPKYLFGDGRVSWALLAGVMASNILVSVLAGTGFIISHVKWSDIGLIWAYDIACLLGIDLLKVLLRVWQLPWMSAGAAYGVLGYPDLPEEIEQASNSESVRSATHGSRNAMTSVAQSRASVRSMMRSHRVSLNGSGGMMGPALERQRSSGWEAKTASMLPFPYNLRADASRNFQSF